MASLKEHLASPQFTDANGESTGESIIGRLGGTWVKPGVPRSRGYLFYGISFFGGLGLVVTSGSGFDLLAMIGLFCVIVGIAGTVEVLRGRPFIRVSDGS